MKFKRYLKNKQGIGTLKTSMITNTILALILLTILFQTAAVLIPTAQAAGQDLNDSGIPLGNLFTPQGVIFIIIAAAIILVVINAFLPSGKSGK